MSHKSAGFIYGPLEHHLDHLAPFCSLMQLPLVLTDEELLEKAGRLLSRPQAHPLGLLGRPFRSREEFRYDFLLDSSLYVRRGLFHR
jgi:hypothetical protein